MTFKHTPEPGRRLDAALQRMSAGGLVLPSPEFTLLCAMFEEEDAIEAEYGRVDVVNWTVHDEGLNESMVIACKTSTEAEHLSAQTWLASGKQPSYRMTTTRGEPVSEPRASPTVLPAPKQYRPN